MLVWCVWSCHSSRALPFSTKVTVRQPIIFSESLSSSSNWEQVCALLIFKLGTGMRPPRVVESPSSNKMHVSFIPKLCASHRVPTEQRGLRERSSGLVLVGSLGLGLGSVPHSLLPLFHSIYRMPAMHYFASGTTLVFGDKLTKSLPSWSFCSSCGGAKLKKKK